MKAQKIDEQMLDDYRYFIVNADDVRQYKTMTMIRIIVFSTIELIKKNKLDTSFINWWIGII